MLIILFVPRWNVACSQNSWSQVCMQHKIPCVHLIALASQFQLHLLYFNLEVLPPNQSSDEFYAKIFYVYVVWFGCGYSVHSPFSTFFAAHNGSEMKVLYIALRTLFAKSQLLIFLDDYSEFFLWNLVIRVRSVLAAEFWLWSLGQVIFVYIWSALYN